MNKNIGVLVNVLSSSHTHFNSIVSEGLWGFPDDRAGVNKSRFMNLTSGITILLYFEHRSVKGIWAECILEDNFTSNKSVKYWVKNPTDILIKLDSNLFYLRLEINL